MRLTALFLALLATGCATAPAVVVRNTGAAAIYVAPACWQPCAQSPKWATAPDGTGDWDALGTDQASIEVQKAACEASRQACADALKRLEAHDVIITTKDSQ